MYNTDFETVLHDGLVIRRPFCWNNARYIVAHATHSLTTVCAKINIRHFYIEIICVYSFC